MWCPHAAVTEMPEGSSLTLGLTRAGLFHFGFDGWQSVRDERTSPSGLGLHVLGIDTSMLRAGQWIDLTYRLEGDADWAGRDHRISVTSREAG